MLTFFGTAPCHRTHSFTKKPADKIGIELYLLADFFYYFFGRFSCERGVGDWYRLECMLYLKICKIILNYLKNVRFWRWRNNSRNPLNADRTKSNNADFLNMFYMFF
jgi:hypothetical protein